MDIPFQAVHRQVHPAYCDDATYLFLAMNRKFRGRILTMLLDKAGALHEHTAGAAGGIEHASMIRLKKLHD
jgi:hypothetical protein